MKNSYKNKGERNLKMLEKKIKELRKVKRYSQQEMPDLLEIKKITYFKYEIGEIEVTLSIF